MKPMSASAYRAHAEAVKAKRPSELVTLKSGSVFELRRPDLQGYVVTGRLPQSLLSEGLKAWKNKGVPNVNTLGDEEIANSLIFMREIVHDCCVNPQFVEYVQFDAMCKSCDWKGQDLVVLVDEDTEPQPPKCPKCGGGEFIGQISAADMLPEDFTEIFEWAMNYKGVVGLEGLQSFREGSERGTPGVSPRGKKQRGKTVAAA